jgi:hypothetical protein
MRKEWGRVAIDETEEDAESRRGFLRLVARTAAAGLGLALLPKAAFARTESVTTCCRNNCKSCPAGKVPYHCSGCDSGCICNTNVGECFTIPC